MRLKGRVVSLIVVLFVAGVVHTSSARPADGAAQVGCDALEAPVEVSSSAELALCIASYNGATGGGQTFHVVLASRFDGSSPLPPIDNADADPPILRLTGSTDSTGARTHLSAARGSLLSLRAGRAVVDNVTAISRGAAFDIDGGSFSLTGSTVLFSDTAVRAGEGATVVIKNSTVVANRRGIVVDGGKVVLLFTTVVSQDEGGIVAPPASNLRVEASLVAANAGGDCVGGAIEAAFSVFGDSSCTGSATPNLLGTFDTCEFSCGQYVEVFEGSPAIDAFPMCGPGEVDARGFARPAGACDAGAFELLDLCNFVPVTIDMNLNGGVGTGTPGDDVIKGTPQDDLILGGGGRDTVCAGAGDDEIRGGEGDDTLFGDGGDDRIFGSQGHDTIDGGDGNDTIHGNRGRDRLNGGRGDDRIYGYSGADEIYGDGGFDSLHGNAGDDLIQGGFDDDLVFGYAGNDTLQGGQGDDLLRGHFGDDVIAGGDGADHLIGSAGNDTLGGGNANDVVEGSSGDDAVNGGWGDDSLDGGIGADTCDGVEGVNTASRCETVLNLGSDEVAVGPPQVNAWLAPATLRLPSPNTSDPVVEEELLLRADHLAYLDDAWFVMGSYWGRPTVWRSVDLDAWQVVYHERPRAPGSIRRHVSAWTATVEFDGQLVIGGFGRESSATVDRERGFMFISDDRGQSWRSVEDSIVTETDHRLVGMVASGGVLVADLVIDQPGAWRPEPIPHRTRDLVIWEPIELPGALDDTWAGWLGEDNLLAVVAREWAADEQTTSIWTSTDGASSFERLEDLTGELGGVSLVPAGVLAVPGNRFRPPSAHAGQVWIHDGTRWQLTPADRGQWGDGGARLGSVVVDPEGGRVHAWVDRRHRSDPHYCYLDVTTCRQYESALVASADGRSWFDVPWLGEPHAQMQLIAPGQGQLVLWWPQRQSTIGVTRWTGPDAPLTIDPPSYGPAPAPIAFWNGETLAVGDEYRYAYGLGFCSGMFVNGVEWLPSEELDTSTWPIRPVNIADGPSAFAYGRIRLEAPNEMSFIVEGQGVVATLHPRSTPREQICG